MDDESAKSSGAEMSLAYCNTMLGGRWKEFFEIRLNNEATNNLSFDDFDRGRDHDEVCFGVGNIPKASQDLFLASWTFLHDVRLTCRGSQFERKWNEAEFQEHCSWGSHIVFQEILSMFLGIVEHLRLRSWSVATNLPDETAHP